MGPDMYICPPEVGQFAIAYRLYVGLRENDPEGVVYFRSRRAQSHPAKRKELVCSLGGTCPERSRFIDELCRQRARSAHETSVRCENPQDGVET